ncbi:MAG: hypothetical protein ACXV7J_02585 [Methylomonas sp.]
MKLITTQRLALAISLLSTCAIIQPAAAVTTPAEQDKLHIHTGIPKKAGDSLFSYTAEWRIDNGESYHSTGMSFLNADKMDSAAPDAVTKKLVTAMKDGMTQLDPKWRGITISQPEDKAEMTIANKAGYSLNTVTVKDYTNQALKYDLGDKTFNSAGVQVAIDLVLAADVEYLDNFSSKKSQTASQGDIQITLDDQVPIHIKTDGKTTRELEQEIVSRLASSQLSQTPLYAGIIGKDKRNNKPFDGSEVQLSKLAVKSLAIEITDPALGVLTKFRFKNENSGVKVAQPHFMLGLFGGIVILALAYFWRKNRKAKA